MKVLSLDNLLEKFQLNLFSSQNESVTNPLLHNAAFHSVAELKNAVSEQIGFLLNEKYLEDATHSTAGAIITSKDLAEKLKQKTTRWFVILTSENPNQCFAKISQYFFSFRHPYPQTVSHLAFVHETAKIGENVSIFPGAFVGPNAKIGNNCVIYSGCFIGEDVSIGNNCVLFSNVSIRENCSIGHNCILNPGVVIGSEGFGFAPGKDGHHKIPQIGGVVVEDDVEIGANSSIDRGTLDNTVIGQGTKIDNLVQIGHNCKIGKHVFICGQVGLAGTTIIEDFVTLAGQVGISGHLTVGKGAIVTAQSGVSKSLPPRGVYSGAPARPHREVMKQTALINQLLAKFKNKSE